MDHQLAKKGFDYARKRKKWLFVAAALGFSGYGVYRVYNLPSVYQKRKRILKLLGALVSIAEVVSDSAESIGVVSKDLRDFLKSDSDKIPNSLKQVSKITRSGEFSESVVKLTQAVTLGVLRGYRSEARNDGDNGISSNSSFTDQVMDKLFTNAGSGFVSVVVGSFARNLVLAFYSDEKSGGGSNSNNSPSMDHFVSETNSVPTWLDVVCDKKCRDLIGDCIQLFVSTAVAIYLDKTVNINTYDDIFSGLTNPKHETKVRDMLSSVCNGAVETLIRTSHQVLANSTSKANPSKLNSSSYLAIDESQTPARDEGFSEKALSMHSKATDVDDETKDSGWVGKVSSTLAVPSNRRFVLDVTGRVASETVRSFLEFSSEKLFDGMKGYANSVREETVDKGFGIVRYANSVREETVDKGFGIVRYAVGKSSVIATVWLSLCLHIMDSPWALVPA
ncbi:hypothetical protein L3X38_034228 [Prunus dulcis]|uniref:Protein PHLOEM PROTEIN 2-LIKE A10 n=1 Tax=Prunus dulcis TaxID=3755 RepID=A0AAD4VHE4_PRUDU|nr:hypothetical protein L3X38_034228 [Prunus dulcis]